MLTALGNEIDVDDAAAGQMRHAYRRAQRQAIGGKCSA
jgi:hypothetical protein